MLRTLILTNRHRAVLLVTHRLSALELVDEVLELGSYGLRHRDVQPWSVPEHCDTVRS